MRLSITFVNATAYGAGTGGVFGINFKQGNPGQFSFVADKAFELEKRPAMQIITLPATNRNPVADAGQLLDGNRSIRVFRGFDNLLADNVVGICGKTAFFTREFFKTAFGRLGAFALQFLTQTAVTVTDIINLVTGESLAIAGGGNGDNAQVNPQHVFNISRFRRFLFAGGKR